MASFSSLSDLFESCCTGKLWGVKVVPQFIYDLGYVDLGLMVYAPAAFIVIGLITWIQNELILRNEQS